MSERSDEPSLKCENCGGLYLTCECIHWRKPTTAPADVPIASSYREGESVIASSYRPEPTARQWWSEKRQLCSTPPPHKPMFEVLHLIEYAAYERLQFELAHMTEKFERNSIAAGEYSLRVEELERNSGEFIHWESHNVEKLEAALEAREEELQTCVKALYQSRKRLDDLNTEYETLFDKFDQARQELASANEKLTQTLIAVDKAQGIIAASQEREARLREALEECVASGHHSICKGNPEYARSTSAVWNDAICDCGLILAMKALEHGKVGG